MPGDYLCAKCGQSCGLYGHYACTGTRASVPLLFAIVAVGRVRCAVCGLSGTRQWAVHHGKRHGELGEAVRVSRSLPVEHRWAVASTGEVSRGN